ncbi:tRNA (adenine(22)-N(1))-methyltransferase [Enterococcus faecalis]
MNEKQLSKRLAAVGALVPAGSRLADIGSDHAYLPVALLLKEQISFAVAGEVASGPFQSAQAQVNKSKVQDKMVVRLADGLAAIEATDEIEVITICGMGGALIRDILEAGRKNRRLKGSERLILQPNIGEPLLREWLMKHGYTIIDEKILEENRKIYEIIVAEKQPQSTLYPRKELLFGPKLLTSKGAVFTKKWQRELHQREAVLAQLSQASDSYQQKIQQMKAECQLILEVLQHA